MIDWNAFWTAAIAGGLTLVALLVLCCVFLVALLGALQVGYWVGILFLLVIWAGLGKLYYGWKLDERAETKD